MTSSDSSGPSFLGTGWGFPPTFSRGGAELDAASGVEDVHQALRVLFATRPGERPMQDSFGCALDGLMFEEVDHQLIQRLTALIWDAVLEHEPRIKLSDVQVAPDAREPGVLIVRLDYLVLETNSRFNMVFPFFLTEARSAAL